MPTYLIIQNKRLLSDTFCDYLMHYRMIPGRTYSTSAYLNTSPVSPSTQFRHPARPPPVAQTHVAGRPSRTTPPFPVPTQSLTPPRLGTRSSPPPPRLPHPSLQLAPVRLPLEIDSSTHLELPRPWCHLVRMKLITGQGKIYMQLGIPSYICRKHRFAVPIHSNFAECEGAR